MKRRSKHSLSHYNLLTTSMGYITPIQCVDVLPGDSFLQDNSCFIRTMPLVAPVMHPVHAEIRSFFVPLRIIWNKFTDFITGGPDGLDASVHPYFVADGQKNKLGELHDYLDVPYDTHVGTHFSALPARAYNAIYNEYFRDQDLEEPVPISLDSGEDTTTSYVLQRASWKKDYFTMARPFEQKGIEASIPLTSSLHLSGKTSSDLDRWFGTTGPFKFSSNISTAGNPQHSLRINSDPTVVINHDHTIDNDFSVNEGGISISDFREAMALQRFQEKRSLYGSRYEDYQAFLGVRSSDARLQHPEYLGGGTRTIQFSEVLQTSEGENPVGTLKGHGIGALRTPRFMRFFNEHGFVITLLIIRPVSIYTQGLPRMFSRETKYDYWQKEYEHIGQQAIFNKEIYAASDKGNEVFGYTNRYNEYRHHPSQVHGEFRTFYADWHLGREFDKTPVLNQDFIKCHPANRIFAQTTDEYDKLLVMVQNHIRARRLISQIGDPV